MRLPQFSPHTAKAAPGERLAHEATDKRQVVRGRRGKRAKKGKRQSSIDLKRNETRAKFSRRITQNAAHHVRCCCAAAIMKPTHSTLHSTPTRMRSTQHTACNAIQIHASQAKLLFIEPPEQRGRNAKMLNKIKLRRGKNLV